MAYGDFTILTDLLNTENQTRVKGGVKRESTAEDSLARVNCLIKYSKHRKHKESQG